MFDSGILDTVIGLVFVFLFVSMLVTVVNEMIAAALRSRAKWLHLGITRLLGSRWAAQLYAHPLIEGTAKSDVVLEKGRGGPSYIPSRSFATVLLDIVQQNAKGVRECEKALKSLLQAGFAADATVDSLKKQLSAMATELHVLGPVGRTVAIDLLRNFAAPSGPATRKWLDDLDARIGELSKGGEPQFTAPLATLSTLVSDGRNARAGIDELRTRFDEAVAGLAAGPATVALRDELRAMRERLRGPYTVADAQADILWFMNGMSSRYVKQMIEAFPDERIRKLLLTLFDDAKNDVDTFKANIEAWFNNGMDRVNGWYKRKSQRVVAVIAILLAVLMNVDAILIFKHLQTNSGAREALVSQASAFARTQPPPQEPGEPAPARPGEATVNSGDRAEGILQFSPGVKLAKGTEITLESDQPTVKLTPRKLTLETEATSVAFQADTEFSDTPATARVSAYTGGKPIPGAEFLLQLKPSLPAQFRALQANAYALALPIGWVTTGNSQEVKYGQVVPGDVREAWRLFLQHGLGWLLTALAASLGAPFWFDMLNRIVSIRSSGKAPEEKPKPPKEVSVPVEPGQSHREADRLQHHVS